MPATLFASVQMQREEQTAWAQTGIPLSARLLNQSRKAVGFKKVHFPRWLLYCQEWLPVNSKAFAFHQQHSFCSKCNSPFTAPGIYRSHVVRGCCGVFFSPANSATRSAVCRNLDEDDGCDLKSQPSSSQLSQPECTNKYTAAVKLLFLSTWTTRLLLWFDMWRCVSLWNTGRHQHLLQKFLLEIPRLPQGLWTVLKTKRRRTHEEYNFTKLVCRKFKLYTSWQLRRSSASCLYLSLICNLSAKGQLLSSCGVASCFLVLKRKCGDASYSIQWWMTSLLVTTASRWCHKSCTCNASLIIFSNFIRKTFFGTCHQNIHWPYISTYFFLKHTMLWFGNGCGLKYWKSLH